LDSVLFVTGMMLSNIGIALPIFSTVFLIDEKSLGFWTVKRAIRVGSSTFIVTVSAIAIPFSAANISWKITPTMNRIKKVVVFAGYVIQATVVAFPVI